MLNSYTIQQIVSCIIISIAQIRRASRMTNTIVVHRRFQEKGWISSLESQNTKICTNIFPDMIFPDCVPSLAVVICDESIGPLDKRLERLEKLQSQFKNAFAIVSHLPENVTWNEYQMMVSGKTLRLLRTFDVKSAIKLALQCYKNMKPSPKHHMQEKYFEMERECLCSSEMSRSITHKAFENMQISEEDAQLVIEGFPTIAHIMTATREEMEENSPADRDAISKISSFFGYQTPTLNN